MRAALCAAIVGALALGMLGCGGTGGLAQEGSISEGQQLFVAECASCHALQHAGAKGTIGPDLDAAFRVVKREDYPESTIREIVAKQIQYPTVTTPTGAPGMPANLVKGDAVDAVASYVACAAAEPSDASCGQPAGTGGGSAAGSDDPKSLFTEQGCGGCHVFEAGGGTGTIGPNLDESSVSQAAAVEQITNGGGAMPAFKDKLSQKQIEALARFVVEKRSK